MLHLPLWRHGSSYRSLDVAPVPDVYGAPDAEVSLAPASVLRRDAKRMGDARAALRALPTAERIARCAAAADLFRTAALPVGDVAIGPDEHVARCARSTGLPHALVRANVDKLATVLAHMGAIVGGLTRGLDPAVLDVGVGEERGVPLSYVPVARSIAAVLPSNSPGVHSLWLPALALGVPVVLKPGSGDPWSPLRALEALRAAGLPGEALGFYPTDHAAGGELVDLHDRAFVFGGADTVARYAGRAGVSVHGPGFAKVLIGDDVVDRWEDHLDLLVDAVARNGGRSCINASTIVVSRHADALAEALAARLAAIVPLPLDHPDAQLAALPDPVAGARIAAHLVAAAADGVVDASTGSGPLLQEHGGLSFLRPTVLRTPAGHPLARTEFSFPFVSVVEVAQADVVDWLGPTLVLTAITGDPALRRALLDAPHVDRLHLGAVPTTEIRWDQPHEGDLFAWTWRRRAVAVR